MRWSDPTVLGVTPRASLCALLTLAPAAAWGACPQPYDFDSMLNDLGAVEASLETNDLAGTMTASNRLRDGLVCLDIVLPEVLAGRVLRAAAAGPYVLGDDAEGRKWMGTATEVSGTFGYTSTDLPMDHPVRAGWDAALALRASTDEADLDLGEGEHYLDGRKITAARATVGRYHVYQRDHGGISTWIIEGSAFPSEAGVVRESPEPPPASPAAAPIAPTPQPEPPIATRGPGSGAEGIALIAAGGASLIASGVLYGASSASHARYDDAVDMADLNKYRGQTNAFVVGSGVTFAAGLSALGAGVVFFVVDGDPRPTLDIRF